MKIKEIAEYKSVPGRGLVTKSAIKARLDYLLQNGFKLEHINRYFLDYTSIQNNIESFIGTVEIPLGIVGPLLFVENEKQENVYTAAGTLEGALIASMNRGAKAISLSGGFTASVAHQKMIRAPLFMFKSSADAQIFEAWIKDKFSSVKEIAEKYSNHAKLISITSHVIGNHVHVKFVYTTGDAAGQNMTTTCTWHAMLWIVEKFVNDSGIEVPYFVIEGNGSSDKKASRFLVDHGRGTSVTAKCFLGEDVIKKVLRTTSEAIYRCFESSVTLAKEDGMLGFNINVANAIAAIFAATGQDLGSIHESSIGILQIRKNENGLALELTLPSLVIGTVGGGTSISKQNEGLSIMNCEGTGKAERFAKLIAGFALGLEISTYAAIVSGEFAKAHEKLGRNKPTKWLLKNEINQEWVKKCLNNMLNGKMIRQVEVLDPLLIENGILTIITQRVNKKLTGFIPLKITTEEEEETKHVLIKSKPLDIEVIKGLHMMAASIDPQLSDLLYHYKENLEYWNSHHKELNLYSFLAENNTASIPAFYGDYKNEEREIFLVLQEYFNKNEMDLLDSENSPALWTRDKTKTIIRSITEIHKLFSSEEIQNKFPEILLFQPWKSKPLYKKMAEIINQESDNDFSYLPAYIDELGDDYLKLGLPLTIIHNDFNPRNVALRKNGLACIYDWELAVKSLPHRDIVEFLCFSLPPGFEEKDFIHYLAFHYELIRDTYPEISWEKWKMGYLYSLKEFMVTRAAFYKVSEILMKLKFGDRIIQNGKRMLTILSSSNQ